MATATVPLTRLKPQELAFLESSVDLLTQSEREQLNQAFQQYATIHEAESSLLEFIRQSWFIVENTPLAMGFHIPAICLHLEAVAGKRIRNLLINIPPGCMKSLICNVFWPAWVWTWKPEARFFFASYSEDLTLRDAGKMKDLVDSEWYQSRWGEHTRVRSDKAAMKRYHTTSGGFRIATTVGGRGTGEHPDYIVVDDPHNVKQSESDLERKQALSWWDGTISLRGVSRKVCRVIIMQRLHTLDLSGHVLAKGGFDHICLPMRYEKAQERTPEDDPESVIQISGPVGPTSLGFVDPRTEPGQLLFPELFDGPTVDTMERELASAFRVAGQMQQRPVPREGGMFKLPWFRIVKDYPREARRAVRYWDKAGTEDGGDWSAGVLICVHEGIYFILDVVRGQWSPHQRNAVMLATAEMDALRGFHSMQTWSEQEGGSAGVESSAFTVQLLAGHSVKCETSTGSKEVRAQPLADQFEAGNVRVLQGPWNQEYITELTVFPMGAHDDQVDGSSGAFSKLVRKAYAVGVS